MGMSSSISPSTPIIDPSKITSAPPKTGASSITNGDLGMAEMMLWLTATMNKTDADVRAQMTQIQDKKELNEALGAIVNTLRTAESFKVKDPPCCTSAEMDKLIASNYAKADWYKNAGDSARKAFDAMVADYHAGSDGLASVETVKAAREAIADAVSANSSSNEMAMIKLQSAISARGQAIQLISNMVNAFNETAKSVVGNIR